ncbi:MAG: hypothetical protein OER88_05800, partial [Planctomycetota bacterium]|nr:hypothetical protein [Planctomycetota bacterium]
MLGGTFRAWARNLVPFSVIAFVIQSPFLVYTWFVLRRAEGGQIETIDELVETVTTWGAVIGIGTVLLGFVVTGAVSYGVFQQLRGRPAALFDCVAVGLRKLLPVLGVGLVAGVAVGAPLIVAVLLKMPILMIALVIPTIVLYCMFWVAVPVAVVERQSVFAAMRRSAQLTKGYKGSIF